MAAVIGRIGQGLRALFAFALPVDEDAVREVLTPDLYRLFQRMTRSEQIHSIRVMKTLRAQGCDQPDLLTAALLHDVGKSRYSMTLPERVIASLILKASHSTYEYYRDSTHLKPKGWRRALVIAAQHPAWSAEDIAAAGASSLAVSLARRHADPIEGVPQSEEDRLLAALQAADDLH